MDGSARIVTTQQPPLDQEVDRTTFKGERCSAANAFLEPISSRPNLRIETNVLVRRILLDGNIATGVEIERKSGEIVSVVGRKEVILSAGAVGTPHLLMLSGIGPAEHLHEMGIEVVEDRKGVGQNLNEHPDYLLKFHLVEPVSL